MTSRIAVIVATTVPTSAAWTIARSPLSAKNIMKPTISAAITNRTSHSGAGITPAAPWIRARARRLAVEALVEPFRVGRLLGRGARVDRPQRAEQRDPPRVHRVALGAVLHPRPLHVDDRAAVTDELGREAPPARGREQMRDLVLLRHRQRLGLGPGARFVVARERQHHDQAQQHGESGRDDAEEARRRGRRR